LSVLKVNQIQTANGVIMANLNSSGANIGFQLASSLAPAFSAYQNSTPTSLVNNTDTKIIFDTENFDTNNNFASSRFTPTVAGYYQISGNVLAIANGSFLGVIIYKNGSRNLYGTQYPGGSTYQGATVSGLIYCNGSTDYLELYAIQGTGSSINTLTGGYYTWMTGSLARSA